MTLNDLWIRLHAADYAETFAGGPLVDTLAHVTGVSPDRWSMRGVLTSHRASFHTTTRPPVGVVPIHRSSG
jgi:hypothetical protein